MFRPKHFIPVALILSGCVCPRLTSALDWPQFQGPDRNLKTTYPGLNLSWPGGEPSQLWQKKVGTGWSGPVVADGKLIQHHRIGGNEVVTCLDAATGVPQWEYEYPTKYRDQFGFDNGPRATPSIVDGQVFTFGAEGRLSCISLDDGSLVWSVDTRKNYGADLGFFGMDSSPLIWNGRVLMQIGGADGNGIMAFDAKTGKVRWSATDHDAGYSSPVTTEFNGRPYAIFFTRDGVTALDPASGFIEFEFPWRPVNNNSVNAASPVITDQGVFISTSYGRGAVLLRVTETGANPFWKGDGLLSNHYATSVYHKQMLFGFHGRVDTGGPTDLRCLDAGNGQTLWQLDAIEPGTLLMVNNTLLVLTEGGKLYAAPVSSRAFKPVAQAQILGKDTRAHPAFANGILYARDKNKLIALDLGKDGKQP